MRQMAHRAGASAARGGPSKTPIMALTDLLGTMRLVGVTVSPMRRVASRDARSRPCASSGQSPYPHEKRQLHERPAADAASCTMESRCPTADSMSAEDAAS